MYDSELKRYEQAIQTYLLQQQRSFSAHNEKAWNQNNYTALVNRYGEPAETARKIEQNPEWRLHPFYKYMGDVKGKNIVHLMGSNGIKAVALGLLGGIVTVVDFSAENAAYAQETSKEAGVSIEYVISDTLSIPAETADGQFDIAFMELGVLHYYIDLHPLWEMVGRLLKQGGMFILHEFHPVSTKLITSTGKKHKVTGNYFNPGIEKSTIAFSKHLSNEEQETLAMSLHRKWTLGEVLTSMARSGLTISVLEEEPNHKGHDIGLPKTYTVVAYK
ncbi:class I SAM-dependent methyltransferase [Peribacillus saganii]|uniref:Class I SAM-dependent methyltransferase n=2 Tax=Peribacillus saganii TaxID=2303992 RepID=A0A372LPK1_9BACI|nr:class I SAM-dependent methyltransferase [Peribacillus saganii]